MNREENFRIQITKYASSEKNVPYWANAQIKSLNELFVNIEKNKKILDVGCGDGIALKWFKDNQYLFVEGVDGNPNKLKEANNVGFITYECDIHDLSKVVTNKYDIIYTSHVLEHMFEPNVVIEEFKKILNDDGMIVIIVPYPDNGPDDAHCGKYYLMTNKRSDNEKDIINVFEKHGLELIYKKISNIRQEEIFLKFKIKKHE